MIENLEQWWAQISGIDLWLLTLGFVAQAMFSMRFLVQWIVTERNKKSTVPEMFWYFSIFGGLLLLTYGLLRAEPIIILGQSMGVVIYARNLYFILREKRQRRPEEDF